MEKEKISLSYYISKAGIASRRKSTELIKNGKVTVNGATITEPGYKLSPTDLVEYLGNTATIASKTYYIMLNKPRGYTCTASDPFAEKLAIDLIDIPDARLFSAGRLDKESEGLIIFTNDGDYALKLTAPREQIQKTYLVETSRDLTDSEMATLRDGIVDEGENLFAEDLRKVSSRKYKFLMTEGKKREIRRLLKHFKIKTVYLKRIAIGKLFLENLAPGKWRTMSKDDIALSLKKGD